MKTVEERLGLTQQGQECLVVARRDASMGAETRRCTTIRYPHWGIRVARLLKFTEVLIVERSIDRISCILLINSVPNDSHRLRCAEGRASSGSGYGLDQVRRDVGPLRCSQSIGARGRTRHRIADRHPRSVHIDRTEKENLFLQRRLAQTPMHRGGVLLAGECQFNFAVAAGVLSSMA